MNLPSRPGKISAKTIPVFPAGSFRTWPTSTPSFFRYRMTYSPRSSSPTLVASATFRPSLEASTATLAAVPPTYFANLVDSPIVWPRSREYRSTPARPISTKSRGLLSSPMEEVTLLPALPFQHAPSLFHFRSIVDDGVDCECHPSRVAVLRVKDAPPHEDASDVRSRPQRLGHLHEELVPPATRFASEEEDRAGRRLRDLAEVVHVRKLEPEPRRAVP